MDGFVAGGGGGSSGASTMQIECVLLNQNGGISGVNGERWINLGIVPAFSAHQNLWCKVPLGLHSGGAGAPMSLPTGTR